MEERKDFIIHVNNINNLANQLLVGNKSLHEEDVMMTFLSSLLGLYFSLIVASESISKKDLSLDCVKARIVHKVMKNKQNESIRNQSTLFIRLSKASASFQRNTF